MIDMKQNFKTIGFTKAHAYRCLIPALNIEIHEQTAGMMVIHSFIHSFVRSFVLSFIFHSFIHSFIHIHIADFTALSVL